MPTRHLSLVFALTVVILAASHHCQAQAIAARPEVGSQAPKLSLPGLDGEPVDLGRLFEDGKTVLVVLRGYPGYQCPVCSRQVAGFVRLADQFEAAGLNVVLIYPGPSMGLGAKAEEFLAGDPLPAPITMLLDPDYEFTEAFGLRWDAPRETAYPATYVIAPGGEVTYANVSNSHRGRVEAEDALAAATE